MNVTVIYAYISKEIFKIFPLINSMLPNGPDNLSWINVSTVVEAQ